MSNGMATERNLEGHRSKCGVCGCKIRGSNHRDGDHHKNRVKAKDTKTK